jgi:hypothetical protein
MSVLLKSHSSIYKLSDLNKNDSFTGLLKLNEYEIINTLSYESTITDLSDLTSHLELLNLRLYKFNNSFEDSVYCKLLSDLLANSDNFINSGENESEFIYFLPCKNDNVFIVRQFILKTHSGFLCFKKTTYYLQQVIYMADINLKKLLGNINIKDNSDSKDPASKETVSKEPVSKETVSKEPDSKETDSKEPDSKETEIIWESSEKSVENKDVILESIPETSKSKDNSEMEFKSNPIHDPES